MYEEGRLARRISCVRFPRNAILIALAIPFVHSVDGQLGKYLWHVGNYCPAKRAMLGTDRIYEIILEYCI